MTQFANFIQSVVHLEPADLEIILSHFGERTVPKGGLVLRKGQVANQYFFVNWGGLRFFYEAYGEDHTAWVVFGGEFFTEASSLMLQRPTRFNIEAIEETKLLYIGRQEMEALYSRFPAWQEFGRKIWEGLSVRMIEQIISFQTLSAEERYLEFMRMPELMQKVPVRHLATFLGITPNALSRIRKNIRP